MFLKLMLLKILQQLRNVPVVTKSIIVEKLLANTHKQICVDCHVEDTLDKLEQQEYGSATDFEQHHPSFSVSMLKPVLENKVTDRLD